MVRRMMVMMGLLAFVVSVFGGLITRNRFEFILSRALWAMLAFCVLGALVGWAAQRVVREYRGEQYEEVFGKSEDAPASADRATENNSTSAQAKPIQS